MTTASGPAAPRTVLVTGSTDGIGKETAVKLAETGFRVLVHGRSPERASAAAADVKKRAPGASVEALDADLATRDGVRRLARLVLERTDRLDVLVNNAGVFRTERRATRDGLEETFAVNHLAPFLLTHLLVPLLVRSAPSRVVGVSSIAHQSARPVLSDLQHEKRYDGYSAYALSKLGNVLFTIELARRLDGRGVTANVLHPGVITTKLLREGFGMGGAPLSSGARTSFYLAASPEVEGVTGRYFVNDKEASPSPVARDERLRKAFWTVSEELSRLLPEERLPDPDAA